MTFLLWPPLHRTTILDQKRWVAAGGLSIEGTALPVSGISTNGLIAETENGTLEVVSTAGGALSIIGHPSSCEGYISGGIDDNGVLTVPGTCSEVDQISATVGR